MSKVIEQTANHNLHNAQIVAKMYVRRDGKHQSGPRSSKSLSDWLGRLVFNLVPLAIIAGGFAAQIAIQKARGEAGTLPGVLAFLLVAGLLWMWNRTSILKELREYVPETDDETQVSVKLFGVARQLSGTEEAFLKEKPEATLKDVLLDLARCYPVLRDELIEADSSALHSPCRIEVKGRNAPVNLEEPLYDGERLVLVWAS